MRKIKYRAYNKSLQKMYSVYEIHFNHHILMCETDTSSHTFGMIDVELMQFTGLLDKNGKEIYEGDILKNRYTKEKNEVKFGDFDNDQSYEDNESGCGWYLEVINKEEPFCTISTLNSNKIGFYKYEVIGNIYQNEEPLKK